MPYGVSNSYNRGIMKTYAGRQARSYLTDKPRVRYTMDENGFVVEQIIEPNGKVRSTISAKERHQQQQQPPPQQQQQQQHTAPSSPTTTTASQKVFSDGEQPTSASPPSSPPLQRAISPAKLSKQPSFRSLKRKRSLHATDEPLGELSDHGNGARKQSHSGNKRTRLTQMQLDLGTTTRRTCRECGMEYVPSSREDERLHKEFHGLNASGVDLGTGFAKDAQTVESFGFGEVVAMLDAHSSVSLRRRVKRVLDVVRADLGAVEIEQETLWGVNNAPKSKSEGEDSAGATDRYRVFVYLAGDKCVGLCLAERIRHASKVVACSTIAQAEGEEELPDYTRSSIRSETSISPVLLGVSRIWVSRAHRRKGIATTLLDCARKNFFYGIEVPKKMVAFSQPTESGRQLAEEWFEEKVGWHVYAETD